MQRINIINNTGFPVKKARPNDAGYDLRAKIDFPINIPPGDCILVPTGLHVQLPPNYAITLLPRSGLGGITGIILGNCVGLIDCQYHDEIFMSIWNRSKESYTIEPGMRLAKMLILKLPEVELFEVEEIVGEDRGGGFGSTGEK